MTLEWETMVLVGRVARAHGNRGRVIVNPDSDFLEDRFHPGNTVYVRHGDRVEPLSIRDVRFHQHRPIVAFDEVATMTEAEELASAELRVPMDTLERLPAGVFYHHELTGCRVETVEGAVVGRVSGVEGDGGIYRLVVDGGSAEILVPLVDDDFRVAGGGRPGSGEPPEYLLRIRHRDPAATSLSALIASPREPP